MTQKPDFELPKDIPGWVESFMKTYWIPHNMMHSDAGKALRSITTAESSAEFLPFQAAFNVLIESLQSVHRFLSFPYGLAKGVMDKAGIPNALGVKKDYRIQLLADVMKDQSIEEQLQRLKQQAVLLLWSAYETYVRDVFVALLNAKPCLYENIQKSPLKDKFNGTHIFSFRGLEVEGFSLVGRLGALLADGRDFSAPVLLRNLFQHLLPNSQYAAELSSVTESQMLWKLGHRRHLVAHRGGIVDQGYLNQTGDTEQQLGKPLLVLGEEIDQCIHVIAKAGVLILLSVADEEAAEGSISVRV